MSSSSRRFTAYLSGEERRLVSELAAEQASSDNYIVRVGVRLLFGLPVPAWARDASRAPMRPEDRELMLGAERVVNG